ncbi:MAG: hypothetical protein AAGU78_11230 [Chloroflexota bacterium]
MLQGHAEQQPRRAVERVSTHQAHHADHRQDRADHLDEIDPPEALPDRHRPP